MFADGRAMRLPVEGTVARGELRQDDHFYRGIVNGTWATTFPMPVTRSLMLRGQERFGIYCTPCHGLAGEGNGIVAQRADGWDTDMLPLDMYRHKLDVLVCVGGRETQESALLLAKKGLNVITLPKGIDNDLAATDTTIGFDTAMSTATEAIDRLHSRNLS